MLGMILALVSADFLKIITHLNLIQLRSYTVDNDNDVKGKYLFRKVGMAVCSSKKFSNKRVNFSQVIPYPSPTTR